MKVCIYQGQYVDFEAPVCMHEDQLREVVRFFGSVYGKGKVHLKDVEEAAREGMPYGAAKRWSVKDLARLLGPESNALLARELKRSPMAVRMKRGDFAPDFYAWARKKKLIRHDEPAVRRYLRDQGVQDA